VGTFPPGVVRVHKEFLLGVLPSIGCDWEGRKGPERGVGSQSQSQRLRDKRYQRCGSTAVRVTRRDDPAVPIRRRRDGTSKQRRTSPYRQSIGQVLSVLFFARHGAPVSQPGRLPPPAESLCSRDSVTSLPQVPCSGESATRRPYAPVPAHKTTERCCWRWSHLCGCLCWTSKNPRSLSAANYLFLREEKGLLVLLLVEMPNLEEHSGVPFRPLTPDSKKRPSCTTW